MASQKKYDLAQLVTVATVAGVIIILAIVGYRYYARQAIILNLSNAVMLNVQLVDAYYAINEIWITDVEPSKEALSEDDLLKFGLARRNLSDNFIIRVFRKNGYPCIIAEEQSGKNKYKVAVSYHFKDRVLNVNTN